MVNFSTTHMSIHTELSMRQYYLCCCASDCILNTCDSCPTCFATIAAVLRPLNLIPQSLKNQRPLTRLRVTTTAILCITYIAYVFDKVFITVSVPDKDRPVQISLSTWGKAVSLAGRLRCAGYRLFRNWLDNEMITHFRHLHINHYLTIGKPSLSLKDPPESGIVGQLTCQKW